MTSASSAPSSPGASSASDDFAAMLDEELQGSLEETGVVLEEVGEDADVEVDDDDEAEEEPEQEDVALETDPGEDSVVEEDEEEEEVDVENAGNNEKPDDFGGENGERLGKATASKEDYEVREEMEGRKRKREEEDDKRDPKNAKGVCPPHPGFMWGVCIRCGENRQTSNSEPAEIGVALRYIHEGLEVTEREAARMRRDELKHVIARKKLYLVLDLDHTLLNSARFIEVPPDEEAYLTACYSKARSAKSEQASGSHRGASGPQGTVDSGYNHGLNRLNHLQMWTKLRPFVHDFLDAASKMFEMYVYTMGERTYAVAMARLLDPTGRFFGDRVISQGDSTRRTTKDLDVVLGAESAVVILDDTEGVWPKHRPNLVLMERYHFFRSSCRQFGLKGLSLTDKRKDESEEEGTLATALGTLRSLHHAVFNESAERGSSKRNSTNVEDVRKVLQTLRKRTLKGCRVVFSRIFPSGMPDMESHPFWRLTEELGATSSNTLHPSATHIVALDRGTDKARWAKKHGKFLVHPAWVEAAQYLWCRPREEDFPVAENNPEPPLIAFAKTIDRIEEESRSSAPENGMSVEDTSQISDVKGETNGEGEPHGLDGAQKSEEKPVLDTAKASLLINEAPEAVV
ncbi:RNA polymerase II C-terminal domain phosphatase-like 3/4 [Marchantia polymorpha subsp. ruderalis]|uniref:RNA polymerase II C-terminal domain phosphatase-like n=2 Tax=Marchantia polymorpha TaxID=3197 RepID=A0A176VYF7_MARPO|nr:hypothetical protein AXG93_4620s2260 [Marchantia polymorpha subsp. ruderalis]PTQ41040.1 hypothetical protein MARPO_0036s0035 [Marchantia polymorpha]PTQ41041.1 hypothetical protein MARPO_0036s0035 [Marchantia polymorpha]BBM97737.1 hypothetical protein Mp_1g07910 [Marchantia polymorpha subsp. ruderalis]BBM97738.1 hypothetical protein Mp_1g07910 [Marchantia polymorpha subsp. ruderalis]|eukprot:PTQ41040.1 hypothetical protein MARPO_0036s0035 [Marchantia polymorpha]